MEEQNITPFSDVYESFLSKITDDMYMELTKEETYKLLEDLLISSIPKFEFPRVNIFDYTRGEMEETSSELDSYGNIITTNSEYKVGFFNVLLNKEEINILSTYMIVEWLGQQLASVENTRMKYSGTDFKFTSQANHIHKLLQLKKDYEREGFHLQRLYKRRIRDINGVYKSTMGNIMNTPSYTIVSEEENIIKNEYATLKQLKELKEYVDNLKLNSTDDDGN